MHSIRQGKLVYPCVVPGERTRSRSVNGHIAKIITVNVPTDLWVPRCSNSNTFTTGWHCIFHIAGHHAGSLPVDANERRIAEFYDVHRGVAEGSET